MQPEPTFLASVVAKALPPSVINGAAIITSMLPQVEAWLRVIILILSATYTGVLIWKALRKKD